jgi:hypothetical protein
VTEVADLCVETSNTMGVGTISLAGAVAGCFSFRESFADGAVVYYCQRQKGGDREVCKGTLHYGTPDTLTRTTVLRSSVPGNGPVNWAGGYRMVYSCLPASQVLLAENALSEIADFLIADNVLAEIAALGPSARDAALGNLGALAVGIALLKAATAAAARTTLGLGSAAILTAGTAAGNALALDGAAKIPPVPGDQLTSLPFHTHAALNFTMTGGSNSKVVRYASAGTVAHASKADTPAQLTHLMARGSDGRLYGRGSLVPFAGAAAGTRYYLGTAGDLATTGDIGTFGVTAVVVGMGVAADVLLFDPQAPVLGNGNPQSPPFVYVAGGNFNVE